MKGLGWWLLWWNVLTSFWCPVSFGLILGQSGGQAPSIPRTHVPTHGSLPTSEYWAIHIVWCVTFMKNALGSYPHCDTAHQTPVGLGKIQLRVSVKRKSYRQLPNWLRANRNKKCLHSLVSGERRLNVCLCFAHSNMSNLWPLKAYTDSYTS